MSFTPCIFECWQTLGLLLYTVCTLTGLYMCQYLLSDAIVIVAFVLKIYVMKLSFLTHDESYALFNGRSIVSGSVLIVLFNIKWLLFKSERCSFYLHGFVRLWILVNQSILLHLRLCIVFAEFNCLSVVFFMWKTERARKKALTAQS